MQPKTVARLYNDFPEVCAIKEATGSLDIASEISALCDIDILSGDDSLTIPLMSIGATGVVSVLSNWAPEKVVEMVAAASNGYFGRAATLHKALFPVFKSMSIETNPVPCKYALSLIGLCNNSVRLPLSGLSSTNAEMLTKLLVEKNFVSREN